MIKLRLQRRGRKNRPYYHIVVADQRSPRDGRVIERLGRFDNVSENKQLILDEERIIHWLKVGAQPSDTVRSLLKKEGLMYRMHLIRWGKSDEEIEKALEEWRAERGGVEFDPGESRKARQKAMLEIEQKEYQKQLEEQAAEEAKKAEAEKAAKEQEEAEAKAAEEAEKSDASEPEVKQEGTEETKAAEQETAKEVADETADETGTASEPEVKKVEAAETSAPEQKEAEKSDASEPEVKQEESAEAKADEQEAAADESGSEEEAGASEPEAEKSDTSSTASSEDASSGEADTSTGMSANDAIEHIKNTPLAELEGFVTESEDRVTVLRAWEAKQSESGSE